MKNLILTISIGNRPWSDLSIDSMQKYAKRIGAHLEVIRKYNVHKKFNFKMGLNNNPAYLIKLLAINDAFKKGYDRIIFLDDACIVSEDCPNLFKVVPKQLFGVHNEGSISWVKSSVATIKSWESKGDGFRNVATPQNYVNVGVMVMSKEYHRDIFNHDKIIEHGEQGFFHNGYPEQTYINWMLNYYRRGVFHLPSIFNKMVLLPNRLNNKRVNYENYTIEEVKWACLPHFWHQGDFSWLTKDNTKIGDVAGAFIYHITSIYEESCRNSLIKRLHEIKV